MTRDDEAQGDVPSAAWAYWDGWRGAPELLIQVVRRARSAVGSAAEESARATCKMHVYVKDDLEPIQDPDSFDTEATEDGLRNFSVIAIDVTGARGRVNVYFARKPHPEVGPPRSGVLVAVSECSNAVEVRETVAHAVERGTRLWKRRSGETAIAEGVRDEVEAAAPRVLRGLTIAVAAVAAVFLWVATGGEEKRVPASDYLPVLWVAIFVGVVWVAALILIPRVEIQAKTRAKRVGEYAYKGVGAAAITALIGGVVKLVFP